MASNIQNYWKHKFIISINYSVEIHSNPFFCSSLIQWKMNLCTKVPCMSSKIFLKIIWSLSIHPDGIKWKKYRIGHITPYLAKGPLGFPNMLFVLGSTTAGATKFTPTSSIFIGFPSSWTSLYLLIAARASEWRTKTTSAVP